MRQLRVIRFCIVIVCLVDDRRHECHVCPLLRGDARRAVVCAVLINRQLLDVIHAYREAFEPVLPTLRPVMQRLGYVD